MFNKLMIKLFRLIAAIGEWAEWQAQQREFRQTDNQLTPEQAALALQNLGCGELIAINGRLYFRKEDGELVNSSDANTWTKTLDERAV